MEKQEPAIGIDTADINYRRVGLWVFIVFSAVNLLIVFLNHYCFRTFTYDYGVYNFAFYDFAHGRNSPCPVYNGLFPISFSQDHFSLTLILFSPLYWLLGWLTGTYTLLVVQWALIVSGAWATFKLIAAKCSDYKIATLALIYYFVLFGRYSAYPADCNLAIMGSAIVPLFLYFFELKKTVMAGVCFIFLVLTREDYPIWFLFICLFLMIVHRKDAYKLRFSAILFLMSVVFLVLTFKVFIPALENEHQKYGFFAFNVIGKTPGEAFMFVISHPLRALQLLFVNHLPDHAYDTVKQDFYFVYVLSGGFLLLYRPLFLIPFLPLLAKKMYADMPFRWSVESYYSVEFVSLLPVMVFLIVCQVKHTQLRLGLGIAICAITAWVTYSRFKNEQEHHSSAYINKYNFFDPSLYQSLYDLNELNDAIRSIPDTAGVSGSRRITPHFAQRERIYFFPRVNDADYIFLLKHDDDDPLTALDYQVQIATLRRDAEWKITQEKADFIIFSRVKK